MRSSLETGAFSIPGPAAAQLWGPETFAFIKQKKVLVEQGRKEALPGADRRGQVREKSATTSHPFVG